MSEEYPSSQPNSLSEFGDATRHLLPQGEKGKAVPATQATSPAGLASPLAGEGARRADEGYSSPKHRPISDLMRGRAHAMRHEQTEAEKRLWYMLRDRRFSGFKFRRQYTIGPYIADFVCLNARLIIEADGSQHTESPRDHVRDAYLRAQNFRLLRLWNNDILARPDDISETIWATLHEENA